MTKDQRLYIEKRDSGKFALERAGGKRAIALFDRQADAIQRAKEIEPDYKPHVARVRNVGGKHPDQFRKT